MGMEAGRGRSTRGLLVFIATLSLWTSGGLAGCGSRTLIGSMGAAGSTAGAAGIGTAGSDATGAAGAAGAGGTPGDGGDTGSAGTGADAEARCSRTADHASVSVHMPDGRVLSCGEPGIDAGGPGMTPTMTFTGMIKSASPSSIVLDSGAQIDVDAPALDLSTVPRVWVEVKLFLGFFYYCQQSLEIRAAAPPDGSASPFPPGRLLLAVVDGNGVAFPDSPYKVAHVPLGCSPASVCGSPGPPMADEYAFDFESADGVGTPFRVYMGDTATWTTSGASFTVRNLRSFQSIACDDFWNWAYTIYADPK